MAGAAVQVGSGAGRATLRADAAVIIACFAALSAVYWVAVLVACPHVGFPLDDAYIHLQFARNLYEDGRMAFNPGVPSSGSTAPLYAVLLAGVFALVQNWYVASALLGALASLGTALLVYGILHRWTGRSDLARWGGLLTVLMNPTLVQAYSGMEAPVYSFVFLAALWLYTSARLRLLGSALFALSIWLRPELLSILLFIVIERAVAEYYNGRRWRALARQYLAHLAVWSVVVAAYVAYHWLQDGHLVPTTFGAKAVAPGVFRPAWLNGLPAALQRRDTLGILLALTVWPVLVLFSAGVGLGINCAPLAFGLREAVFGSWRSPGAHAAARRLALLTLFGYPWLRGLVDPASSLLYQLQRYYAHMTPLLVLIVIGAIPHTGTVLQRRFWNWRPRPLPLQQRRTMAWACAGLLGTGALAIASVSNITSMQVPIGQWVKDHTSADHLVATNDIGAIGFISRRPILDTIGLIEPELVTHFLRGGTLRDYLRNRSPAYVIVFPEWYPELSARPDLFQRVHSVTLRFNVICGGSELVIYRPRWTGPPP